MIFNSFMACIMTWPFFHFTLCEFVKIPDVRNDTYTRRGHFLFLPYSSNRPLAVIMSGRPFWDVDKDAQSTPSENRDSFKIAKNESERYNVDP